ncbi:uncharacterized protein LOC118646548 [Monomorium pharaonis]|uniref:uncharacterized protein LOC118646548 n=1 Tax=Monomorium pharaonis TaxID=307658 RepID=UPI001747C41F|nr:uncharacterized protein LOC118646548 [Monomorium pharaonis]
MTDILNIENEPIFDDRIIKIETHTYNPFANTTFDHSDEIRIPIQHQDLYTLPSKSFLYIEGKVTIKKTVTGSSVTLGNNCIAFMFDEIRYELDGVEIDRNRNVGITSTLKNYITMSTNRTKIANNAGWDPCYHVNGYFNFCVPLNMLLGFCEDYKRVVINARHELILIRARNDNNCLVGDPAQEPEIELFKVQWRIPHVLLNERNKLSMLRALESRRYSAWLFVHGICMSFHYCNAQPNIHGLSRPLLSSRSRVTSSSLCRLVGRTSCLKTRVDSMIVN